MKSDALIRLRRSRDPLQNHGRRNTDRAGKHDQLDHIDPTLAALDPGNEGLMTLKALGHSGLGQTCRFPGVDQRLA